MNYLTTYFGVGHGFPQFAMPFVGWAFESEIVGVQVVLLDVGNFGYLRLVRVPAWRFRRIIGATLLSASMRRTYLSTSISSRVILSRSASTLYSGDRMMALAVRSKVPFSWVELHLAYLLT